MPTVPADPDGLGAVSPDPSRLLSSRQAAALTLVALVAIAGFALLVRAYRLPDLMVVSADQGRDAQIVEMALQHARPILEGPVSSVALYHRGPAYYYLLAGAYALTGGDPIGGVLLTVVLDVVALAAAFVFVRAIAGTAGGLFAAGLWAVSPALIANSQIQWNPNDLPVFVMMAFLAAYNVARGRGRWLAVFVAATLIGWQLHEQALFYVPACGALLIVGRRAWLNRRDVLLASLAGAVVLAPFLITQVLNRGSDIVEMVQYVLGGSRASGPEAAGPDSLRAIVDSLIGSLPAGLVALPVVAALAVAIGYGAARLTRQRDADAVAIVSLAATPVLLLAWPGQTLLEHYLIVLLPIPILLAGVGIGVTIRWAAGLSRLAPAVVSGLVAAVVIGAGAQAAVEATHAASSPMAWPRLVAIAREIRADAAGSPFSMELDSDLPPSVRDAWEYALQFVDAPLDPDRIDLVTFVISDAAMTWQRLDPLPLASANRAAGPWTLSGAATEGTTSTGQTVLTLTPSPTRLVAQANQQVELRDAERVLVRFDARVDLLVGRAQTYLQVFDATGALLETLPTSAGHSPTPDGEWSTASFVVPLPAGADHGTLILRATGSGTAEFARIEVLSIADSAAHATDQKDS